MLLLLAALAGGCEDSAGPRSAGIGRPTAGLYEVTATVLESEKHGPKLCLGFIALSNPPQCGDVALENWDWDRVEGEKHGDGSAWGAGMTTWGQYRLTGTYDGDVFTVVTSAPPGPPEREPDEPIDTPCPEPAGGWAPVDPTRSSEKHLDRAARVAKKEPDYGDVWVDYYDGRRLILNLVFTGSLERHERELRELWGGPLCLTKGDRTHAELQEIRQEVSAHPDLDVLWSSTDGSSGTVEIGVAAIDAATLTELDERYGEGVVRVEARLRPVE